MPIASSLVLALAALAQQAPDSRILQTHARALAKEEAEARAAAEAYFDGLSTLYLGFARNVTAYEAPEVRDAVRRRLPHPFWAGVMEGTIGDVRRRERELLGDPPVWTMAALSKAGQRLLEGSKAERLAGLRLLARAPGEAIRSAPLPRARRRSSRGGSRRPTPARDPSAAARPGPA